MKEAINPPNAPERPYSVAVCAGDFIYVSGQIGSADDKGNELKTLEAQTKQCFEGLRKALSLAGSSLDDVVKVCVYLSDAANFNKMNEIYQTYFTHDKPARTTVVTGLPLPGMLLEIDCIAYKPGKV
ncbi:MAG: RidA family protein [Chloroflexi bacterium]|nr:RidA family protein [Chloroflexota bacterium]